MEVFVVEHKILKPEDCHYCNSGRNKNEDCPTCNWHIEVCTVCGAMGSELYMMPKCSGNKDWMKTKHKRHNEGDI